MFKKYQHVERFGRLGVEGIEKGFCFVFPKLDGTNASIWWDNGIQAGSRNRALSYRNDNRGFFSYVMGEERFIKLFKAYPYARLYGEWLVPHKLRTYRDDAWNKFYVFDVMENGSYVNYNKYSKILDEFEIDYIPCVAIVEDGNEEYFERLMNTNNYLMKKDEIGEGVVIKNYRFLNRFGKTIWAKMVRSEFKEQAKKPKVVQEGIEADITDKYVTKTLVDKEKAKIDTEPIQPRLLSTVYHCILVEELPDIVKKWKNPIINFKILQKCVNNKVKEHAKELF